MRLEYPNPRYGPFPFSLMLSLLLKELGFTFYSKFDKIYDDANTGEKYALFFKLVQSGLTVGMGLN